jgi:predicted nuclease of predicted toxin-antitoxin system
VRFLLDHDVDAAVGQMLRQRGHECWRAASAGLARARDDELTVWAAEHQAVLVSTDGEFGQRRMQNAIGRHVWLRCSDWDASEVLADRLDEVLALLEAQADLTVRVSANGVELSGYEMRDISYTNNLLRPKQ